MAAWIFVLASLSPAYAYCSGSGCTAGVGLLQKSPRQQILMVQSPLYDWSPVDGGLGRACRGASAQDNQASYYTVVSGILSIDACKAECMKHVNCQGVEFSGSRCEVWTRPGGIEASIALGNFECWSYKPSLFLPVDGGVDRQCQGDAGSEVFQEMTLDGCKHRCLSLPACKGLDFSTSGCKIMTSSVAVASSSPQVGATCLRLEFFLADPAVQESACRGESLGDNSGDYYTVMENVGSMDECKQSCREEAACQGIEYATGRCEVWTKPGGINYVKPLDRTTCLKYSAALTTTTTTTGTSAATTTTMTSVTTVATMETTTTKKCREAYQQCGGNGYTGETCCIYGWECVFLNDFYSQCNVSSQPTTTLPLDCDAPGTEFAQLYRQCGGRNWKGPRCCEAGSICVFDNDYYSGCKPDTSTTTSSTGSTTSTTTAATTTTTVATTTAATTTTPSTTTTAPTTTTGTTTTGATTTTATTTTTTPVETTTVSGGSSTSTTSSSATTTDTTTTVQCKKRYEKCGGKGYTGATCCEDGWWCIYGGPYYSQCKTTTTTTSFTSASPELQADSQFLIQATFGPTRASLLELGSTSPEDWIQQQFDLEPSFHRAFYRERATGGSGSGSGAHTLVANTVEAPASAETWRGGECPSVPRTFLNEAGCQLLLGCAPLQLESVQIELNVSVLQTFYEVEGRYVYAVTDLTPTSLPCGEPSRWKLLDCSGGCSGSAMDAADALSISTALQAGQGVVRDIAISCVSSVPSGVVVQVGSEFFQHVHSSEQNVYDFSEWVREHPGGADKIRKWTSSGYVLRYPASHPIGRFESALAKEYLWPNLVGIFGKTMDIRSLPQPLQTVRVGAAFGALGTRPSNFAEVCGSPGEVAERLGHFYPFHTKDAPLNLTFDVNYDSVYDVPMLSRASIWTMQALKAPDQLRQRMAWALSQIFVVAPDDASGNYTEMYVNYYDIFVRHAFGNFRDILREVTYSPVMGDYLTYKRNRAFDSDGVYPDENYAREIQQLFTIGLWKLNSDGSRILEDGEPVPTYSNRDIMNFARVFTGFDEQAERGNIEHVEGKSNMIDPMQMRAEWHDVYPKPKLDGGYLGDGYPLCSEQLNSNFLQEGAKYRFLGYEHSGQALVLAAASPLYQKLCGGAEVCNHRLQTELMETLPCFENECSASDVTTILVRDGFYEFQRPACVELFFRSGEVILYPNGEISSNRNSQTAQNPFLGHWLSGAPPESGSCPSGCSPSDGGCLCPLTLDQQAGVHVLHAGGATLQNPPVFMDAAAPTARDALFEVEALLDHLLEHPNVPSFVALRLIQRFVTSNPSKSYVTHVADAFRSGAYQGVQYGRYGDLKATILALLLDPEARSLVGPNQGALREPYLKLIHLMRSMEYDEGRPIFIRNLIDAIGEFPYASPTVFNFYLPEFEPEDFPEGLVAPEFQIFTPPNALAYANGLVSLIDHGLAECDQGFGVPNSECSSGGSFAFQEVAPNDMATSLPELDLLLTGGRLENKGAVQAAYQRDGWKDAQKAMVLTPEFNTMGHPMSGGVRPPSPPPSQSGGGSDYKAVIMLFLKGGMDSFQMLVPLNCPLYDEYTTVRRSISLLPEEVHKIQAQNQPCTDFGIHPRLPFIKELYDEQKVTFVNDVGSLVEPLTPDMIGTGFHATGGTGKRCQGLFSHADQQRAAETLTCQYSSAEFKGAGGRIADAVAKDYNTASFSMRNQATWPQGFDISGEVLGQQSSGESAFPEYERLKDIIDNITGTQHGNIYCEEYAKRFQQSISFNLGLEKQLENAQLQTDYEINGYKPLQSQFKKAATLIAARAERQAERDFFFVEDGGWDAHSGVEDSLYKKFGEVNEAVQQLVQELEAQNVFDRVVIVTHSDFARTLTPNSNAGTDHGWSGIQMVLSGAIQGGMLNAYPHLAEDSAMDAGRGRLIPRYPLEGMMMPVAEWMGMDASQASQVFPNIGNFNSSHLLTKEMLFKS